MNTNSKRIHDLIEEAFTLVEDIYIELSPKRTYMDGVKAALLLSELFNED